MYYAQLNSENLVTAITETSDEHAADDMVQVDSLDASLLGKRYDPDNGTFNAVAPASVRVLSKLQYMNRFTDAELAAVYTAAKSVVAVEIWLEKFKLASEINLDDPGTVGGLQAMEAAGLIGVGRAAAILA